MNVFFLELRNLRKSIIMSTVGNSLCFRSSYSLSIIPRGFDILVNSIRDLWDTFS